jgi:predicted nucleotidyltransferase component of viral defense system
LPILDFAAVRRVVITAMFSDDLLSAHLVLKGGNALNLVYGLSNRTSLDLDFSMDSDFPDVADAQARLFHALHERFDAIGIVVSMKSWRLNRASMVWIRNRGGAAMSYASSSSNGRHMKP